MTTSSPPTGPSRPPFRWWCYAGEWCLLAVVCWLVIRVDGRFGLPWWGVLLVIAALEAAFLWADPDRWSAARKRMGRYRGGANSQS